MTMLSMEFHDQVNPFCRILVLGDPHMNLDEWFPGVIISVCDFHGEFILMSMFVIESSYKCPWFPWSYNINVHGFFGIIILKSMVSVEVSY